MSAKTAQVAANVLRATFQAARAELTESGRWPRVSKELASFLASRVDSIESPLSWYQEICARFGVDPTSARDGQAVEVYLDGEYHPWMRVVAKLNPTPLRLVLRTNAAFFAQYATMYVAPEDRESVLNDQDMFAAFDGITEPEMMPIDLSGLMHPPRWRAVHVLLAPLAHGADSKTGNVTGFRRETRVDALTGAACEVPFISGAAVRGALRDMLVADMLHRLGVEARDCRPEIMHALFAGGSIDAGETMKAMPQLRARLRALCPIVDMLGGTFHGQLMEGAVLVGDMILVCRETAWLAAPVLGATAEDLAPKLQPASACLVMRQGTRKHHAELPQEEGAKTTQMLFQTEAIAAGNRVVHSFSLRDHANATPMQQSLLAHMLTLMAERGSVGAKQQAGFGELAVGEYKGPELAANSLYLDHLVAHREELVDWLKRGGEALGLTAPVPVETKGKSTGKKGSKKGAAEKTEAPAEDPATTEMF